MIRPITPQEKDGKLSWAIYQEAISYINDSIIGRDWHDNFSDGQELREKYFAISIKPYKRYSDITMNAVVAAFNKSGWDCLYGHCYDARGPHSCFYVNRKHFY